MDYCLGYLVGVWGLLSLVLPRDLPEILLDMLDGGQVVPLEFLEVTVLGEHYLLPP